MTVAVDAASRIGERTVGDRYSEKPSALAESFLPHLLPNRVLRVLSGVSREGAVPQSRLLVGTLVVFVMSLFLLGGLTAVQSVPLRPIVLPIILASATCAISLLAIPWLVHKTVVEMRRTFDSLVIPYAFKQTLFGWFDRVITLPAQLRFATACTVLAVVFTASIDGRLAISVADPNTSLAPFPVHLSTYAAMALAALSMAPSVYYALLMPYALTRLLSVSPHELPVCRLNPSRSVLYHSSIRIFNRIASAAAVVIVMALLTIASLRPVWTSASLLPIYITFAVGAILTTLLFVSPQLVIARFIRAQKERTLSELHEWENSLLADALRNQLTMEKLQQVHELAHGVDRSPNTVFGIGAFGTYLAWLIAQFAAVQLGLVPWRDVVEWLATLMQSP